jgi:autotransporter adhesin
MSVAIGGGDGSPFSPAFGDDIVVPLNGALASGFISIAIGTAAEASGGGSSAFGLYSRAIANDSAAFGEFSTASGATSIAIGVFSEADGTSSIAIGKQAVASKKGAVAIGEGSVANSPNTVSVGHPRHPRRITNVAPATAPSDAVTLAQAQQLLSAAVASASAGGAPSAQEAVDDLRRELADLRRLLQRQQQRIAELERKSVAGAPTQ